MMDYGLPLKDELSRVNFPTFFGYMGRPFGKALNE